MRRLERLALGCILPGFDGTAAPDWVRRLAAEGLGGVVLFGRNVESREQVRRLTDSLHGERPGLVVAIDEEGGEVTRLEARSGSSYPGNLALGYAGDVRLTREVAAAIGTELAGLGIGLNLAPVADVNTDPRNPVIGARSFGSDEHVVALHTAAWVQGLQSAGVAASAKHFPGHGDTSVDSHLALPVAGEDPHVRALEPFKAAIAAGVKAIMSAHILVPWLDRVPATVSARIMTGVLRDELGFQGVAISDGLEMAGLTAERSVPDAATMAVAAGCDLVCVGGGLREEQIVLEIARALAARVPQERLMQAAARIETLTAPLAGRSAAERPGGDRPGGDRPGREVGLEAARRGLCVEGDVQVGPEVTIVTMPSPISIAAGDIPWGIDGALVARGVRTTRGHGRAVIAVRDLHRQPDNQRAVDELLDRHPQAIVVEMGVPVHRPRAAKNYIATHGSARVCAQAAAEVMTANP